MRRYLSFKRFALSRTGQRTIVRDVTSGESIVVFGFGALGSAQSLNLRDSGRDVLVSLRPQGRHIEDARSSGFEVILDGPSAARQAHVAGILISDALQPALYNDVLRDNLPKNSALVFAHGFAVHYKLFIPRPDLDVVLVAPLAHAAVVRGDFQEGRGVPCLIAVAQDATGKAHERAMYYANAVSRGGPFIETTFAEEVESDLFAEQAVLCGGMPELVRAAFDTLVSKGINPDIAYVSCLRELRAIVNVMDKYGISGMRERISDTARYGAITRGPRIIGREVRKKLETIFDEIKSGAFAREIGENKKVSDDPDHLIERVHKRWMKDGGRRTKDKGRTAND